MDNAEQEAREPMPRELLAQVVDRVFGGAIEDASVIEEIYAVIAPHVRQQERKAALEEAPRYHAFICEIMKAWPDRGIDGDELQDIAVSHGLLTLKSPKPTEPCGENCVCAEYAVPFQFAQGVDCYRRTYKDAP